MVFHDGSCYVSRAVATEVTKEDTVQQNTGGICKSHPIICPSIHPSVHLRGLDEPRRGLGRGGMDRWTDGWDIHIPPVFYRTLYPLVPSGAAVQKAESTHSISNRVGSSVHYDHFSSPSAIVKEIH